MVEITYRARSGNEKLERDMIVDNRLSNKVDIPFMDFTEVQERLSVEFKDPNLLHEALTHPSSLSEPQMGFHRSNEALAWLGDALIDWVISAEIFNPSSCRGDLSDNRKDYVEEKVLAELAQNLGLDSALIIPEHRVKEGGRTNLKNLHTVYEAVVGAIYRDKGYEQAKDFVLERAIAHGKRGDETNVCCV